MMLDDWQFNFASTALEINDNTITFQHVICFMTIQEMAYNAKNKKKHSPDNDPDDSNADQLDDHNTGHHGELGDPTSS